jgi:endonuclease/exonuclease/phosphatase family metal-dependent hydrolase
VGIEIEFSYVENGRVKTKEFCAYVEKLYASIQGGGETYTASELGGDCLYTCCILAVPNTVKADIGNMQVVLKPFGNTALERVDGTADLHGKITTFDVPTGNGVSIYNGTPDTAWYSDSKTEFTLTTASQLMGFQQLRVQGKSFEGKTVKLGADMVLNQGNKADIKARGASNYTWDTLTSKNYFKGCFDGQGHVISGVYMSFDAGYRGMFGVLAGNAVIKDLTVCNSYFITAAQSKESLGGIAGRIVDDSSSASVTISNVTTDIDIWQTRDSITKVGGIVGEILTTGSVLIENCTNYGNINTTGEYVGGIVGYAKDCNMNLILKQCTNVGDITAERYLGGIAGGCFVKTLGASSNVNYGTLTAEEYSQQLFGIRSVTVDPTNGTRADGTDVRVMSYNVRLNLDYGKLENRVEGVRVDILQYAPDIIGLQEDTGVWHNNLTLAGYTVIKPTDSLANDVERSAIFYKNGLTCKESGNIWLTPTGRFGGSALTVADLFESGGKYQLTPDQIQEIAEMNGVTLTSTSPDSVLTQQLDKNTTDSWGYQLLYKYSRNATYGVFEINGQTVITMNTHLQQRTKGSTYDSDALQALRNFERLKQFEIMMQKINELKQKYPTAVVYLTGDLNDLPFSDIYEAIRGEGFESSAYIADEKYGVDGSSNLSYDSNTNYGYGENTHPEYEGNFGDYLDYIFVSAGMTPLKFISGDGKSEIADQSGQNLGTITIYTSDHLPIIADIKFS